jgi:hypothetical protein
MFLPPCRVAVRQGAAIPPSAPLLLLVMLGICPTASSIARGGMLHGAEPLAAAVSLVDGDFAYQGEYVGDVRAVCGTIVPFGLQVVALGDQHFTALGHQGGLPGNGWDRETSIAWDGRRDAEILTFDGPRGRILIRSGEGTIIDSRGAEVGRVRKVRRLSSTLGARPPHNAIVLFDGRDLSQFQAGAAVADATLAAGAVTKMDVRDFQLHLEFRTPYMPRARNQARGNSGVYIQQRYEVQILDSFGLVPRFDGCGALYRQQPPALNMSFPPLDWQTYDIYFRAPRWDDQGTKHSPARITVMHNGVAIHQDRDIPAKTGAGEPEGPQPRPIRFQFHGDPVQFRNVWLVAFDEPADARDPYVNRPNVTRHMSSPCAPVPMNWHTSSTRN